MKGQTTLEFIGSMLFFIIAILGILAVTSEDIPRFYDDAETTEKNLEAKHLTEYLLTNEDEDFDFNEDYMVVNKDFLEDGDEFATIGDDPYNYTQMRDEFNLQFDYNFQFTWYPIIETERSFIKGESPEVNGDTIDEPEEGNEDYESAENRVHYGEIQLNGAEEQQFLVTAIDGEYRHVWQSDDDWDFELSDPKEVGENVEFDGRNFEIESIQNREDRPGAMFVISDPLNPGGEDGRDYFGSSEETATGDVVKINRYPILEDQSGSNELMKMEVLVW